MARTANMDKRQDAKSRAGKVAGKAEPPNPRLEQDLPKKNSRLALSRLLWWLGLLTAIVVACLLLGDIIAPFFTAFVLAWLLNPLCEKITKRLVLLFPSSSPSIWRAVVALFLTLALLAVLLLLLLATLPFLLSEALELISAAPRIATNLQSRLEALASNIISMTSDIYWLKEWQPILLPYWDSIRSSSSDLSQWQTIASQAFTHGSRLFSQGLNILAKQTSSIFAVFSWFALVPFATFYLLKDWDDAVAAIRRRIPQREQHLLLLFSRIDETLSALLRGQVSVFSVMALFYGLLLTLIGLPHGFAVGIASGVAMVVPYIGSFLGATTALIIAYVHFGFSSIFFLTLSVYFFGQMLESYFLTPRLVGKSIGLHPLWIIFCILAGGSLAGFLGILLALPIGASVRAIIVHIDKHG